MQHVLLGPGDQLDCTSLAAVVSNQTDYVDLLADRHQSEFLSQFRIIVLQDPLPINMTRNYYFY